MPDPTLRFGSVQRPREATAVALRLRARCLELLRVHVGNHAARSDVLQRIHPADLKSNRCRVQTAVLAHRIPRVVTIG